MERAVAGVERQAYCEKIRRKESIFSLFLIVLLVQENKLFVQA
jgi:hypothetical protein